MLVNVVWIVNKVVVMC